MASNLIESVRRLQTQYEKLVERVEDERKATAKTMQKLAQLRSCNSDLEQECKLLVGRLIDEGIAVDDANTILNSQAFQNEGLQLESFIKREEEAKKCLACARQRKVELMEQRQSSIIASMANMKVFSAWEENAQFELNKVHDTLLLFQSNLDDEHEKVRNLEAKRKAIKTMVLGQERAAAAIMKEVDELSVLLQNQLAEEKALEAVYNGTNFDTEEDTKLEQDVAEALLESNDLSDYCKALQNEVEKKKAKSQTWKLNDSSDFSPKDDENTPAERGKKGQSPVKKNRPKANTRKNLPSSSSSSVSSSPSSSSSSSSLSGPPASSTTWSSTTSSLSTSAAATPTGTLSSRTLGGSNAKPTLKLQTQQTTTKPRFY